jgi:hypothetical protein
MLLLTNSMNIFSLSDINYEHMALEIQVIIRYFTSNKNSVVIFSHVFLIKQDHMILVLIIMAVSFIGGGNQSAQRKPQTCCKSLTNFIT